MKEIQEVFPRIYLIPVPLPENPLKELNCYLIRGEKHNLLIDTGFRRRECYEALKRGMNKLGIRMDQTDIFLTHSHSDHSGLAPEIVCNRRHIYVGKDEISRLDVSARNLAWEARDAYFRKEGMPERCIQRSYDSPGRKYACVQYSHYIAVEDGERLQYDPYTIECLAMPGHSPGHMCLYIRSEKVMFLGDHVLFDITPNITSWVDFRDALGVYLGSLKRLQQYPVDLPLPGHRAIYPDLAGRIIQLKEHHRVRLNETLQIVHDYPGACGYEIAGKMKWRLRCRSWEDFPESQRSYAVGEAMAHLDYLRIRGFIERYEIAGIYRYTIANANTQEI